MKTEANKLANSKFIITGVTGFIGQRLFQTLAASGANVYGLSRHPVNSPDPRIFACDITDRVKLNNIIAEVNPSHIFHLAATKIRTPKIKDFRQSIDVNLIGTLNLLEACEASACWPRFISLGTCEEYGGNQAPYFEMMREMPVSGYSYSKVAVTQLLQTFHQIHGFPVVILRPSLAYGPNQGSGMLLPMLIRSLLMGEQFAMSPGEQTRDFVYIDDVIAALLKAAGCSEATGQVINISSGEPTRVIEVAKMVAELVGNGAESLLDKGRIEYRKGEPMNYWADRMKAKDILGWEPYVNLHDGLTRTVEHYRSALSLER